MPRPPLDIDPDWLRERYPNETMIVLQEWFEDLAVMGDRFRVTLNFSNQPETLVIPFDAVKTFVDPSAKFGLKFDDHEADETDFDGDDSPDGEPSGPPEQGLAGAPEGAAAPSSADVVRLDRFRKS